MDATALCAAIAKVNGVSPECVFCGNGSDEVLAFAFAAPWDFWKEWPLFVYMIEHLQEFRFDGQVLTTENSYQYGPVCVDRSVRGKGVFEAVFFASLDSMRQRWPYMATFVNQINPRSYNAHSNKANMATSGTFDFNNNHYCN